MRSLLRDLLEGFRHPQFWAFSGWLEIVAKYRMSRLGILWLLMPSTLYIWGVGSFFALLQGHSLRTFAAYMAVGVMVFRFMTSVITDSATAYIGARAFIMDGHMRLSDFVLRVMAKALFFFLMSIPAAAVALYVFPALQWSGLMMGLAAFPLVLVNMLWIGVVFSLIGARHPDLSQFIGNIFMFLFLLTPIIWSAAQMPPGSLRSKLVTYNPFYYLIEIVRAPIIDGHYNLHALYICAAMAVIGSLLAIAAYRRWSRWVPIWI
jgi:ABC-type polysaccharide/polyol phosphate export permease